MNLPCTTEQAFAAPSKAVRFDALARTTLSAVSNVRTRIERVGMGDWQVPATVNESGADDCWVCSPYAAYVKYAAEEADRLFPRSIATPLSWLCSSAGSWLNSAGIDEAVSVNNWLVSTNLYPLHSPGVARQWRDEAIARWPGKSVWFRSLNMRHAREWMDSLERAGCILIPSRQVYLFDDPAANLRDRRDLRRDQRLLSAAIPRRVEGSSWSDGDFERASELYRLLYLEKYSPLNPDYRAGFLRAWHGAGLLDLVGYRAADGRLDAIVGTFSLHGTMTAPIVGYDTSRPPSAGLYRLLMATVIERAAALRERLNLSAGAAGFKRSRGGEPAIEYSAVHLRHLPRSRQRALQALGALTRRVGVPMMERFKL